MEDKKSLVRIIGDTIGRSAVTTAITAVTTAIVYSAYSGLSAAVSQDATFADKLKDPISAAFVTGIVMGSGIGTFLYYGAKALAERYKSERRETNLPVSNI